MSINVFSFCKNPKILYIHEIKFSNEKKKGKYIQCLKLELTILKIHLNPIT